MAVCCITGEDGCPAQHSMGWVCTKRKNHKGNHIACDGIDHRLKTWENKGEG